LNKTISSLICVILFFSILSGCWDHQEVENRNYVLGIGIDFPKDEDIEKGETEDIEVTETAAPLYRIAVEFPLISPIEGGGEEGQNGPGSKKVIIATARTPGQLFNMQRRSARTPFYGHLKAIVIGEEVAREGVVEVLDYIERSGDTGRRMSVIIAKGEAKSIFDLVSTQKMTISEELIDVLNRERQTSRVVPGMFNDVLIDLRETANTLMPRVRPTGNGFTVGGSAVIKDNRLIGWLGEVETATLIMLRGENAPQDTITVRTPKNPKGDITFNVQGVRVIDRASIENEDLTVRLRVMIDGDIVDQTSRTIVADEEFFDELEEQLERSVIKRLTHVIDKLQEEFQVDLLRWGRLVRKKDLRLWEQWEEDWDDVHFPETNVEIDVKVNIRRAGLVE
jgi:Ger(x)C family germination protein